MESLASPNVAGGNAPFFGPMTNLPLIRFGVGSSVSGGKSPTR